jgi:hypothetical protein
MRAAREKNPADFDLERFIDMFDEAVNSKDERVVNALRSLMMMVILTKSETQHNPLEDRNIGPLRQLFEDFHNVNRRLHDTEERVRSLEHHLSRDRSMSARDIWGSQHEPYGWRQVNPMTSMTDEDYKRAMVQISNKINTPGKL